MSTHRKPTPEEILDDARDTGGGRIDSTPQERARAYDLALRQAGYLDEQGHILTWAIQRFGRDIDDEAASLIASHLTTDGRRALPPALINEIDDAVRRGWANLLRDHPNIDEYHRPLYWNGVADGMTAERDRLGLTRTFDRSETIPPWISLIATASDVKMLQEALSAAEPHVEERHRKHLARLLSQLAEHRPVGTDGKHGDLHTETCGCDITEAERARLDQIMDARTIEINLDTGEWVKARAISGEDGARIAAAVMPGWPAEEIQRTYSAWMEADQAPADATIRGIVLQILGDVQTDALVTNQHAESMADEITAALQARGIRLVIDDDDNLLRASAWSDYRSEYGASGAHDHQTFTAGWDAARGTLDIGGVQR